jgi:hypothetical protein
MLSSTPSQNHGVWRALPGFYWHAAVTKNRPGAQVLAVHASARNQHGRIPLLVTRHHGNGKVLFMGTDAAWRWRRGVEDTYHYRFWGQVVRWMAHQRHLAHGEGVRFFFSPERPRRGDKVFLHATVFDRSGFPLKSGTVRATFTAETGESETLNLTPAEGGWGVFTGSFVPRRGGKFKVSVVCEEAERRLESAITVTTPTRERVGRPARVGVLHEIAAITDGRKGAADDLADMIRKIVLLPEPEPLEERFRLWCHPWWGGLIVTLLVIYWTSRKLMGFV